MTGQTTTRLSPTAPRLARWMRRAEAVPFWSLLLLSLAGHLLIRFWFPLTPYYNQAPLADIGRFLPTLGPAGAYGLLLVSLFGLYWLAYRQVARGRAGASGAAIWLGVLVFSLTLLTTFPYNATDLYRYTIRGRVASFYGADPFRQPPAVFPQDPYLPLAGEWATETSPYGPLWEQIAAGITGLVPDQLLASLLLFKLLAAGSHLLVGGVIWQVVARQGMGRHKAAASALLWLWNPALLLTFVVDGHNDVVMILWLVLAWWLLQRGQGWPGLVLASLAALTKPIGLLALPFLALVAWRGAPTTAAKVRLVLAGGAGILASTILAFLPYGNPLPLANRLVREATASAGFSPATLLLLAAQRLVPGGLGGQWLATISHGATFLFGLSAMLLFWLAWSKGVSLPALAGIFAAYLATALSFRLWYAAWPFPWLVLDHLRGPRQRRRLHAGILFLLTTQLSVLIYGQLWRSLLGRDHFLSHLIGVPFTFALPPLLAWLGGRRQLVPGS